MAAAAGRRAGHRGGAWATLADLLDDTPHAGPVLDLLRRVTVADDAVLRAAKGPRMLGEALARLESAPSTVAELAVLGPQLTRYLGFDRAIFPGSWTGLDLEAVYVVDDPEWAEEINRIGREQPQRLVPGLHETEVVRRNEPMIVTDVQRDTSRVHRRIAEASRSDSYVAVPVMSGNSSRGTAARRLLHPRPRSGCDGLRSAGDLRQGPAARSQPGPAAEQLNTIGSQLRTIANECHDSVASVGEFSLGTPDERSTDLPSRRA